ncbi:uroporphyrin-III C-methyltransferase [Amylocystis lapponica]|nr:uroporphyrin-III C-methyltransferase [Amylocystis lapponica]
MAAFPPPTGGASLLLSFRLQQQAVVVIGSDSFAASRAFASLEADSTVIVIAKGGHAAACEELKWRASQGQLILLDLDALPGSSKGIANDDHDAEVIGAYISAADRIRLVCVTDTVLGTVLASRRSHASAAQIVRVCRTHCIPVNVTDMPDLCDFSFLSTHRFHDPDTLLPTGLQLGVTTNGQGCRLAGRLRRDVVAKLPKEVGGAVAKVGKLRSLAKAAGETVDEVADIGAGDDGGASTPNQPVPQRKANESAAESARRRMKWVAQVSEYWPINELAQMSDDAMAAILDGRGGLSGTSDQPFVPREEQGEVRTIHALSVTPRQPRGKIFLVGSGPGHPSLLTVATHNTLTKHADLVLSDKLVPAAVLALIPPNVEVRIARKFPGNADGAQNELMEAAVEAAKRGLTIVRLKQGDPSVYGRAGEEVLYFRAQGFEPIVIPGVSSVLAGPTFAGIPVTQRGAAESFVVCTGVGRQGKEVKLPGYQRSRTLVILMGVARLPQVLETLLYEGTGLEGSPSSGRDGPAFPPNTPIALIERASMPDQRAIYATLRDIATALESAGEQRPPGMLVVGWSVLSLWAKGDMTILDDGGVGRDEQRLEEWLGGQRWKIKEGLDNGWEEL